MDCFASLAMTSFATNMKKGRIIDPALIVKFIDFFWIFWGLPPEITNARR